MAVGAQTTQSSLLSEEFTSNQRNIYSHPPYRTHCTPNQWFSIDLKDIFLLTEVIIYTPSFNRSAASNYVTCGNTNPITTTSSPRFNVSPTLDIDIHDLADGQRQQIASVQVTYMFNSLFTHAIGSSVSTGDLRTANIYTNKLTITSTEDTGILLDKVSVQGDGEYYFTSYYPVIVYSIFVIIYFNYIS